MMFCQHCSKPMKERLVTDEFLGSRCDVTVTGIQAGVCSYCGHQAVDADTLDEIEMFVRPLLGGHLGMRMLASSHLTIDLGHSLHPSAIDIAGPSVASPFARRYLDDATMVDPVTAVTLAGEAA